MPPLRAYAIDIIGSMSGIAAFSVLSALGTTPVAWFSVVGILLALMGLGAGLTRWSGLTAIAMVGVVGLSIGAQVAGDVWSPYYRLTEYTGDGGIAIGATARAGRCSRSDRRGDVLRADRRWFPTRHFGNVLVVGAGEPRPPALPRVDSIDAVEIDPAIQATASAIIPTSRIATAGPPRRRRPAFLHTTPKKSTSSSPCPTRSPS
jgi:hypothetical protein